MLQSLADGIRGDFLFQKNHLIKNRFLKQQQWSFTTQFSPKFLYDCFLYNLWSVGLRIYKKYDLYVVDGEAMLIMFV